MELWLEYRPFNAANNRISIYTANASITQHKRPCLGMNASVIFQRGVATADTIDNEQAPTAFFCVHLLATTLILVLVALCLK